MEISAYIQVFTGGYRGSQVSFPAVQTALEQLPAELTLSGVVMGWAPGKTLYLQTLEYLKKKGIPLYLWLPVFSETSILENCAPLMTVDGESLRGQRTDGAEAFDFCCPASQRNIENAYSIFRRHFMDIGFDGIFLDKIRYPSPANVPWGWRVCFCPSCLRQHQRQGLSPDEIRLAAERLHNATAPFTTLAYENGAYRFADLAWERFFKAKADVVTTSVKTLSSRFRAEGYRVGLDVFAPFLSPFVGQDIAALSRCCDWIKPMMYRKTHAPAGLPFEINALCQTACPDPVQSWFSAMTGGEHKVPDSAFLRRDLEYAGSRSACPIFPGLEVNRIPKIADITPTDVWQGAEMLPKDTSGVVLSWNLLCAPEDNVKAAAQMLQRM